MQREATRIIEAMHTNQNRSRAPSTLSKEKITMDLARYDPQGLGKFFTANPQGAKTLRGHHPPILERMMKKFCA